MNNWRHLTRTSDSGHPSAGGPATDLVWFADDPAAAETWAYGYPSPDADERAARAWAATAQAAAEAAGEATGTLVVGEGTLARLVRLALPPAAPDPDARPAVVVETTGTAAGISDALAAVRPRGRVLLAARPLNATTPLRTYHALHLPSIRMLPVPWRDGTGHAPEDLVASASSCIPEMRGS